MQIFKMPHLKTLIKTNFKILITLLFLTFFIQSCKVYKSPTTLNQAALSEEEGYVKVTMLNGDEYIYETIIIQNNQYYGISTVDGKKVETALLNEQVQDVQRVNKKSSNFFGFFGILVGVGSIILGVTML